MSAIYLVLGNHTEFVFAEGKSTLLRLLFLSLPEQFLLCEIKSISHYEALFGRCDAAYAWDDVGAGNCLIFAFRDEN